MPRFKNEEERLIWCTAFATYPRDSAGFADVVVVDEYTGPCGERQTWDERAATHADAVIDGYRELMMRNAK